MRLSNSPLLFTAESDGRAEEAPGSGGSQGPDCRGQARYRPLGHRRPAARSSVGGVIWRLCGRHGAQ